MRGRAFEVPIEGYLTDGMNERVYASRQARNWHIIWGLATCVGQT